MYRGIAKPKAIDERRHRETRRPLRMEQPSWKCYWADDLTRAHPLNSIAPYLAAFWPSFVECHVLAFTEPDDTVFDPVNGRGGTIFESHPLERKAHGLDITSGRGGTWRNTAFPKRISSIHSSLRIGLNPTKAPMRRNGSNSSIDKVSEWINCDLAPPFAGTGQLFQGRTQSAVSGPLSSNRKRVGVAQLGLLPQLGFAGLALRHVWEPQMSQSPSRFHATEM